MELSKKVKVALVETRMLILGAQILLGFQFRGVFGDGYDLLPKLQTLTIPSLVISGDHDFIPAEIAAHIARAMPKAQLVTLKDDPKQLLAIEAASGERPSPRLVREWA